MRVSNLFRSNSRFSFVVVVFFFLIVFFNQKFSFLITKIIKKEFSNKLPFFYYYFYFQITKHCFYTYIRSGLVLMKKKKRNITLS